MITTDNLKEMSQTDFETLVAAHQGVIRAHCYRMLGSAQEADDMAQETFWRAWQRRETFAGRAAVRTWLYRIATNLCIDSLRKRPRRGLPVTRQAAARLDEPIPDSIREPIWLEPYPFEYAGPEADNPEAKYSAKESVQLAFLNSLQVLPPRQRAVLILCDVLGWRIGEAAETLEQTLPAVKSALHRARATLAEQQKKFGAEPAEAPAPDSELQRQLARYVRAWEAADVDAFAALLKEECSFSMPPIPSWYSGRANVAGLVRKTVFGGQAAGRWRLLPTRANGQPGFGLYRIDEQTGIYQAYGIQVVTFAGAEIQDVVTFRNPALVGLFGLAPIV